MAATNGEAITTYAALLEALGRLPPPPPGHLRVYRGQNYDWGNMTPTALRPPYGAPDMVWPIYASKLAEDIAGVDTDEVGDDLSRVLLWVRAIKQHYGPGTEFLDVTHSVGVAAWFALHKIEWVEAQAVYGPPGPFDARTDVVGRHQLIRHVPFDEAPAFLYAFDAREETTIQGLEHGSVFDLAHAPAAFSSSARIQAQRACLMYAKGAVDDGDLSGSIVPGTPLRIGWPLTGCAEVTTSTNGVFPTADIDDWYARFVALPLAPDLAQSTDETVFDHPVQVSLYVPDGSGQERDSALLEDLTWRFVVQRPPLLYASRSASAEAPGDALGQRFRDATALLLEGPMMTTVAPVEQMNLRLLPTALSASAPTRDLRTLADTGRVSLTNVFIELSALDAAGWEQIEQSGQDTVTVRGMWLVRDGDRFAFTVFMAVGGSDAYTIGPVEIRFDEEVGRFDMRGDASVPWEPLDAFHAELGRPFYKALALVRALSPRWKLGVNAQYSMGADGGSIISYVGLEWALGEIRTLRSIGGAAGRYCALRQWDADEPFYGDVGPASPVRVGGLRVTGGPYARTHPAELIEATAAEIARRDAEPPPAPLAAAT